MAALREADFICSLVFSRMSESHRVCTRLLEAIVSRGSVAPSAEGARRRKLLWYVVSKLLQAGIIERTSLPKCDEPSRIVGCYKLSSDMVRAALWIVRDAATSSCAWGVVIDEQ